jgi:hypothetical protein
MACSVVTSDRMIYTDCLILDLISLEYGYDEFYKRGVNKSFRKFGRLIRWEIIL